MHWRASPEGMPLWGPNRFWQGSGLVLRCLGPGFTVLALGPAMRDVKDMGQQMGYRSLEWNWPKEAMNRPIGAGFTLLLFLFSPGL